MADRGWIPLVWPVPLSKVITQPFGANYNYYFEQFGWTIGHSGLDIRTIVPGVFPSGIGTPIIAVQGGIVTHAGWHTNSNGAPSGYGIAVILKHPDNTYTLYAHCNSVTVSQGQTVRGGQQIAKSGNTGNSSGPHLHFELWQPPFNTQGVWGRRDPTHYMEEVIFVSGVRGLSAGPEMPIYEERNEQDGTCNCPPFVPSEADLSVS